MQYCITVSRTQTTAIWFEAYSDEEARDFAHAMYQDIDDTDFDDGGEYDYSVCDADGATIVDWDD